MAHAFRFFRAGGVDQVNLSTAKDLLALGELDQKLWVALACPVEGLELDARTLALVDEDKDGRVRANELIAAAKWVGSVLKDPEELVRRGDSLNLAAIDTGNDEGKLLHQTAKTMLSHLGKGDATAMAVADLDAALTAFAAHHFNGDGIVTPEAAEDPDTKKAAEDVLSCVEAPPQDRSGKPGFNADNLKAVFEAMTAYAGWLDAGAGEDVKTLGDGTAAAHAAFVAVRDKVEDYFGRCRIAAYDARALAAVQRDEKDFVEVAAQQLAASGAQIEHFPLAHVKGEAGVEPTVPLGSGVNPAWAARMAALKTQAVLPILGDRDTLDPEGWEAIKAKLAPFDKWMGAKAGASVEKLGADRVRALLTSNAKADLEGLLTKEKETEPLWAAIDKVKRLVLYNRDLFTLANNFVAFRDFYSRTGKATFQAGTLYLDQRALDLCIRVANPAKHGTMAPHAKTYLVYCDCKNAKGKTMSIAAAVTDGDVDNIMVGRNGVFYDRDGGDWDATITKIVDAPISIKQAFWSPYKKFLRMIEDFINKRAAAAEAESDAKMKAAAGKVEAAADGKPEAPAAPKKLDIGVVAALGVGVGGIVAAFGAMLEAFFGLGIWMPLGVLALLLVISGPSMAIAWLKLRNRNLGPLLDANGWAVNALAKVNVPLGRSLTALAELPKGASRDLADPFAEKRRPWGFYAVVLVIIALAVGWYIGSLDKYLPAPAKSVEVLGEMAPAHVKIPEAPAAPAEEAPKP
ncbi:MAG: hypothetical protein H6730_30085 [Deltaproteobacteria bacterium]|nr:hypothetical protein [Deltaproteobacteria bacterium]